MSLYRKSTAKSMTSESLASEDLIQAGMEVVAYFAEEDDSESLHSKILAKMGGILEDPSAVSVEFASHCSTAINLTILRTSESTTMNQLLRAFEGVDAAQPEIYVISTSLFEAKEEGMAAVQTVAILQRCLLPW